MIYVLFFKLLMRFYVPTIFWVFNFTFTPEFAWVGNLTYKKSRKKWSFLCTVKWLRNRLVMGRWLCDRIDLTQRPQDAITFRDNLLVTLKTTMKISGWLDRLPVISKTGRPWRLLTQRNVLTDSRVWLYLRHRRRLTHNVLLLTSLYDHLWNWSWVNR